MRARKPWFRKSKNAWYVEVDGKQVRLAVGEANEKSAFNAFYKLMATGGRQPENGDLLLVTLCDLFLEFSKRHHADSSYDNYKRFLQNLCRKYPRQLAAELKPLHITAWLDGRPKWKGARWHAISAIKRDIPGQSRKGGSRRTRFSE